MTTKARIDLALLMGIILSVALTSLGVFARDWEESREGMLRLHIIAASDSEEDQRIKYAVRDRILAEGAELFSGLNKDDALAVAEGRLADLERIAAATMREKGVEAPVRAELVNMYFGTRIYGETAVAAGWYDAVRITLGEGKGQNWWCVMFPPMCLPSARPERGEYPELDRLEELGQPRYIPKFAVVELVEEARNRFFPPEAEPADEP